MARTLLQFFLPLLYAFFWTAYLLGNYFFYAENDPAWMDRDYQLLFESNRWNLLFAELLFPLVMGLTCWLLFFFQMGRWNFRWPFLVVQFLCLEFFVYRQFLFSDQYAQYQSLSQLGGRLEQLGGNGYWLPLLLSAVLFLVHLLAKASPAPGLKARKKPFPDSSDHFPGFGNQ